MLCDLKGRAADGKLKKLEVELGSLKKVAGGVEVSDVDGRYALYERVCKVRRKIVFSNPLLDFDKLLFIKRYRATFNYMCDQYYGINIKPGGGVCVLTDPFGDGPKVKDILADSVVEKGRLKGQKLSDGSYLSPDLSYDGKKIMFAYVECKGDRKQRMHTDPSKGHWYEQRSYHVFSANVDGTTLKQLTDVKKGDRYNLPSAER